MELLNTARIRVSQVPPGLLAWLSHLASHQTTQARRGLVAHEVIIASLCMKP